MFRCRGVPPGTAPRTTWLLRVAIVATLAVVVFFVPRARKGLPPVEVKFLGITNVFGRSRYAVEITNRLNSEIQWRIVTGSIDDSHGIGNGLPYSTPFPSGVWRGSSRFNDEPPLPAHSAHYLTTIALLEPGETVWLVYSQTNSVTVADVRIRNWRLGFSSFLGRNGFVRAANFVYPKRWTPQVEPLTIP